MKKEKRNEKAPVKVYLTSEEHNKLEILAERSGYSKSSYMRQLLCGLVPPQMPPKEFHDFVYELNKIGVNLNQIAKVANMTGDIKADEYNKNYEELKDILSKIRDKYLKPGKYSNGNY